jgi:AAHS family 4-hydroxybenzoate transporter-like MFS transporter
MQKQQTIDIKAFIDERPTSPYQWLLVVLCCLVVIADGMDVAIMGFIAPSVTHAWGISKPAFGLVMSAAPIGLVIGALAAGPSADRFGRKTVLVASVVLFSLFTILTAQTSTPMQMAALRVLTGIGLGAAMPNTTTLLAEYAPQRLRGLMITLMFCGFNLGSALIGFVAGWLIPASGWRAVLMFGGVVPLLLIVPQIWLLPESARLLAVRGARPERIAKLLNRVCRANFTGEEAFVSTEPSLPTRKPIGVLFSRGYSLLTIALWVTYFMGLLVIYLLTGWLPTLFKDAGLSISTAANVTAMFQIGGTVGAIVVGWIMDRTRPAPVIAVAYVAGGVAVTLLAWAGALSPLLSALVFAVGFCMSGAQTGLNAYAPGRYPTAARATGVSWMLGMGRFGSIFGSAIGGALLGLGWSFQTILAMLAVPALLAAVSIVTAGRNELREPVSLNGTACGAR